MIDKKIYIPLIIIFILLFLHVSIVNAQLTENDIITILTNQNELDYVKSNINNASDKFPSVLKDALFGNDKIYHIKIGDYNLGAELKNGKVTNIWPGIPKSPTHIIRTDYDTILKISNSDNSIITASEIISEGKIKIEKTGASKLKNSLKSISLSIWIARVVGFIVVVVIIILIIKTVKKRKIQEQKENVEPPKETEATKPIEKSTFDNILEKHEKRIEEEKERTDENNQEK